MGGRILLGRRKGDGVKCEGKETRTHGSKLKAS